MCRIFALVWMFLPLVAGARQVPVILDSDVGNDCEDAAAIGVLHALADKGEARILAMIYPMHDPWGAAAMSAINTYYGRPGIPIGTYRGSFAYKEAIQVDYGKALATEFPIAWGAGPMPRMLLRCIAKLWRRHEIARQLSLRSATADAAGVAGFSAGPVQQIAGTGACSAESNSSFSDGRRVSDVAASRVEFPDGSRGQPPRLPNDGQRPSCIAVTKSGQR